MRAEDFSHDLYHKFFRKYYLGYDYVIIRLMRASVVNCRSCITVHLHVNYNL